MLIIKDATSAVFRPLSVSCKSSKLKLALTRLAPDGGGVDLVESYRPRPEKKARDALKISANAKAAGRPCSAANNKKSILRPFFLNHRQKIFYLKPFKKSSGGDVAADDPRYRAAPTPAQGGPRYRATVKDPLPLVALNPVMNPGSVTEM